MGNEDKSNTCFQVAPADNVATALVDLDPGRARVFGPDGDKTIDLNNKVKAGHKLAIRAIKKGESIIKFGVPIGHATGSIQPGAWVHLHNCASNYDERSQTLDPESGATTDTAYS